MGPLERPAGVTLPDTGTAAGISQAIAAVSQAVSAGRLTPSEAEAIGRLLNAQANALGLADTERRLARLEAALKDSEAGDLPHEETHGNPDQREFPELTSCALFPKVGT
jgi:hypothetical protein